MHAMLIVTNLIVADVCILQKCIHSVTIQFE